MRIAVIGTGISGLAAAHRLAPEHDLTVFEAAPRLGGHSNTVTVEHEGAELHVDTGFIVCNDRNYPAFLRLMDELGIALQDSHMSFSVADGEGTFEYAGTPRGLYAQRSHLWSPRFTRMLRDLVRFNARCRELLELDPSEGPSLRELLTTEGYSEWFAERLIVPQAAAVWSAQPERLWDFPAAFLARFFHNHGMLGFRDRPQWMTVSGGSRSYVDAIAGRLGDRVRLSSPVTSVTRSHDHVEVIAGGAGPQRFDEVVIATHSDQALAMLTDPSAAEREILGAIPYQRNEAILHTDTSLLPRRRAAWASWNYHLEPGSGGRASLTYWMNNLQRLGGRTDFCVSLNRGDRVDPASVIEAFSYEHPVFTPEGVTAQTRHGEISGVRRTHYCGAYWRWGFHEDGAWSALRAVEAVGRGDRMAAAA